MNSQDKIYSWKRFWCPRTGRIDLSDDGYLSDPDVEGERAYNPDVMPFESIESIPCLALLGEPGIGKTSAMQLERESIQAKVLGYEGIPISYVYYLLMNSTDSSVLKKAKEIRRERSMEFIDYYRERNPPPERKA